MRACDYPKGGRTVGVMWIAERPASHVEAGIVADTWHSVQVMSTMSFRRNTASIGFLQTGQLGSWGSPTSINLPQV